LLLQENRVQRKIWDRFLRCRTSKVLSVKLLLAEAAARDYSIGSGSSMSHYNEAVTQSILAWGGTVAEANIYLAQTEIGYRTVKQGLLLLRYHAGFLILMRKDFIMVKICLPA